MTLAGYSVKCVHVHNNIIIVSFYVHAIVSVCALQCHVRVHQLHSQVPWNKKIFPSFLRVLKVGNEATYVDCDTLEGWNLNLTHYSSLVPRPSHVFREMFEKTWEGLGRRQHYSPVVLYLSTWSCIELVYLLVEGGYSTLYTQCL